MKLFSSNRSCPLYPNALRMGKINTLTNTVCLEIGDVGNCFAVDLLKNKRLCAGHCRLFFADFKTLTSDNKKSAKLLVFPYLPSVVRSKNIVPNKCVESGT